MAHALGAGTDAGQLWMDAVAGTCTVAVVCALTWRIGYHRTTTAEAGRLGATTRAVPVRHRPTVAGTGRHTGNMAPRARQRPPKRHPDAPTARTTTQLLERDPR